MTDGDVLAWLVERGCPAVRLRTLRDILRVPATDPELARAVCEAAGYGPALAVADQQKPDGTWAGRLHTGDARTDVRLTTEIQLPRLREYGWGPRSGAVARAAELLLPFLEGSVADEDYRDLRSYMTGPRRGRYIQQFWGSIAAGLLAHAGFADSPAVIDAARRLLRAAHRFVTGPAAHRPVAGDASVIVPEAYDEELDYPAIPDLYLLQLLAYCPVAVQLEGQPLVEDIVDYALGATYDGLDQRIGLVGLEDRPFVKGWKIELPTGKGLADAGRWRYGLIMLEMFARITDIRRHPRLTACLEWLESECRLKDGLYDLPAELVRGTGPFAERVRLSPDWRSGKRRISDLTFRVCLIKDLVERGSRCSRPGGPRAP